MYVRSKITLFLALLWSSFALANGPILDACESHLTHMGRLVRTVTSPILAPPAPETEILHLDTIAGRIKIVVNQQGESSALLTRPGQELRPSPQGDGSSVIASFRNQTASSDPTTMRVEERAVVAVPDVEKFVSDSAKSQFLKTQNHGQPVIWEMRDIPRDGYSFVNFTEIGRFLTFELGESGIRVGVKPRYRRYYEVPNAEKNNPSKWEAVQIDKNYPPLIAFELKFASLEGPNDGALLSHQDSVFKPRFFYTQEIDDRLKSISGRNPNYLTQLDEIKQDIIALQANGQPLNNPAYIEEDFEAIKMMVGKEPDFLRPVVVVKNGRRAYEARTVEGTYQFTTDFDIEIFKAIPDMLSANVLSYFQTTPIYKGGVNENHVELKSPVSSVLGDLPIYKEMITRLRKAHLPKFKPGAGKFSLARYSQEKIGDQEIDSTLIQYGTDFWLVKQTGQLTELGKGNDVVKGKRMIKIAIPFTSQAGQVYRMVLEYYPEAGDNLRAPISKSAYLKSIEIRDRYGFKVEIDQKLTPLLIDILDSPDNQLVGLEVEGIVIPIKGTLTPKERENYLRIMKKLYAFDDFIRGGERDAGVLAVIEAPGDVKKVVRRLDRDNQIQHWRERFIKAYPMIIMGGLSGYLVSHLPISEAGTYIYNSVRSAIVQPHVAAPPALPPGVKVVPAKPKKLTPVDSPRQ